MKYLLIILFLFIAVCEVGCGKSPFDPGVTVTTTPLELPEWDPNNPCQGKIETQAQYNKCIGL